MVANGSRSEEKSGNTLKVADVTSTRRESVETIGWRDGMKSAKDWKYTNKEPH
jgi:hypothetical protein